MTDKSKQEMEFLVTTEGLLFQDESVKKFYLIIKYFILDLLENIWNIYNDNLDEYKLLIQEYTKDELNSIFNQLIKKFPKLNDDFIYIIDLYKKFIYKDEPIFIKSPDIYIFLKCFLKKLIPIKQIQNGSYFSFHSIEQDFILRDIFRQTLFMDCLEIDNEKHKPTELLPVFETKKEDSIVSSTIKETIIEKESEKQFETILKTPLETLLETPSEILKEKCQEKIEDILPLQTTIPCEDDKLDTKIDDFVLSDNESITEDDSISRVMEKMYLNTLQDQPKKKIKKIILT
jgi:hypothetical protein